MKRLQWFSYFVLIVPLAVLASCNVPGSVSFTPTVTPQESSPPRVPVVVADKQIKAWAVATDDTNVYWTDCGSQPSANDGKVMKAAKAGGTPVALASNEPCPTNIVLDSLNVYWLAYNQNDIFQRRLVRVAKSGGPTATLTTGQEIRAIAVDDGNVYWSGCGVSQGVGALMSLPKQGGSSALLVQTKGCSNDLAADAAAVYWIDPTGIFKLAKGSTTPSLLALAQFNPRALLADETNLYWITDAGVMTITKAGGTPNLVSDETRVSAITADAANIYWADSGGMILRAPKGGGAPAVLTNEGGIVYWLAVDNASVYWTTLGKTVMRATKSGGAPLAAKPGETTLAGGQEGIQSMALDETDVYWTTCRFEPEKYGRGTVMRVPKSGGAPTSLATNQACPQNVVVDAANVYWINLGAQTGPNEYRAGTVMRIPKKGGTPMVLAAEQHGQARLVVDAANVYWTGCGTVAGKLQDRGIFQLPKEGGTPRLLIPDQRCPSNITLDAESIYWLNADSLLKAKRGGEPQVLAAGTGSALAVDSGAVYWMQTRQTSRTTFHSCADERSALMRISKEGGTPTQVAEFAGVAPSQFAMDEKDIYWVNECSDGIRKVSKAGGSPVSISAGQTAGLIGLDAARIYWSIYSEGRIVKKAK